MKRRLIGLSALGIVAWLIFMLALLPARFVLAQFGDLLPPELYLHGVQGTVWNGSARELVWHDVPAGPLHWDIQALALLIGHLQAAIETKLPQGFANFTLQATPVGNLELSNVQLAMPLTTAARLAGQSELLQGDLTLQLETLRIENMQLVAASGSGMLGNLRSSLLGDTALGSYQGEIRTTDTGITVTATDQSGPLHLQAQADLDPQGKWQAIGTIGVRDAGNTRLAGMLQYLGPADASGMHRFRFSGQLP